MLSDDTMSRCTTVGNVKTIGKKEKCRSRDLGASCLTDNRYGHVTHSIHEIYHFLTLSASFIEIRSKLRKLRGDQRPLSLTLRNKGSGQLSEKNFGTFQYSDFSKISRQRFFRWVLSNIRIKKGSKNFSTIDEFKLV